MNKYSDYDQKYLNKYHKKEITIKDAIYFTIAACSLIGFIYVVNL